METQSVTIAPRPDPRPETNALVLILEGERPAALGARFELTEIERIRIGRGARRRFQRDGSDACLWLPDPKISSEHCVLDRSFGRWRITDCGSKNGTFVAGSRVASVVPERGEILQVGSATLTIIPVPVGSGTLDLETEDPACAGMWTLLPELADAFARAQAVVEGGTPMLITGPTGTGKEVAARALHEATRPGRPFVAVNCGGLAPGVVESELFGHRRGAFSGSVHDHLGLVRKADGGTLLLDEIAELPPPVQVALLRVVQERKVRPVGSTDEQPVDVSILGATHGDLPQMVETGAFRGDLYARIAGYSLVLPRIAERREDLSLFVRAALGKLDPVLAASIRFDANSVATLLRHAWPFNARELVHVVGSAAALADGGRIRACHLPAGLGQHVDETARAEPLDPSDAALAAQLIEVMRVHRGNVAAVARELGKDRRQIHRWLQRFGIEPDAYRSR